MDTDSDSIMYIYQSTNLTREDLFLNELRLIITTESHVIKFRRRDTVIECMCTHLLHANTRMAMPYDIESLIRIENNILRLMKDKIGIEDKHRFCMGLIDLIDDVENAEDILNYCCQGCTNIT